MSTCPPRFERTLVATFIQCARFKEIIYCIFIIKKVIIQLLDYR